MDFNILAEAFDKLEATSSRLEMTDTLSDLFKKTKAQDVDKIIYLLQGRVSPAFTGLEIGIGEKFVAQALAIASGHKISEIDKMFKEKGDLGLVAEEVIRKKQQRSLASASLTVQHVFEAYTKIAKSSGQGSQDLKIKLLAELMNNASPVEAKFLARIPLGQLRLGIGDPTILDAFSVKEKGTKELRETLERAYNLCSDLGLIAKLFWEKGVRGVEKVKITPGNPIRPALAERLPTAKEIIEKLGKCAAEKKYDGFRIALHKYGNVVWLFSRKLENTTHMFPEIVEAAKKLKIKDAIFEGEALSYNEETGEYLPFQVTMQRKRKYGVDEMAKAFPLRLFVFDVLYLEGKDYTREPYEKRRKVLEKIIKGSSVIQPAEMKIVETEKELEKVFEDSVSRGLEGVMCKDLKMPYVTGARKFAWIKLKRSYRGELSDTVDVVIVGYSKGKGTRTEFGLGTVLTAVYDEKADMFRTVAKVGSGFSEAQMVEMKEMLDKIKVKHRQGRVDSLLEPDVWVEPKYVITVNADEITMSPIHTCGRKGDAGYALRFPRIVGDIRSDKSPEEATSVEEIISMYKNQKRTAMEDAAPDEA